MVSKFFEVGLVEEQDLVVEEMKVYSVGIVGKQKIVGKVGVGMLICLVSMSISSPILNRLVLVCMRRPTLPRHRCIP